MSAAELQAVGAFRDSGSERAVTFVFNRKPTDNELRALHALLAGRPTGAAFNVGNARAVALVVPGTLRPLVA